MVKTVCLLGLIACLVVAWSASEAAYLNFTRGAFDMRSFDMPRALLFAPIAPSFLLMAIEATALPISCRMPTPPPRNN